MDFMAKMGQFCPVLRSISTILGLVLRHFGSFRIRLNMQEVKMVEIQYLFYSIPYRSLEKTRVGRPFLPFYGVISGFLVKSAKMATFPLFLTKRPQFP